MTNVLIVGNIVDYYAQRNYFILPIKMGNFACETFESNSSLEIIGNKHLRSWKYISANKI